MMDLLVADEPEVDVQAMQDQAGGSQTRPSKRGRRAKRGMMDPAAGSVALDAAVDQDVVAGPSMMRVPQQALSKSLSRSVSQDGCQMACPLPLQVPMRDSPLPPHALLHI